MTRDIITPLLKPTPGHPERIHITREYNTSMTKYRLHYRNISWSLEELHDRNISWSFDHRILKGVAVIPLIFPSNLVTGLFHPYISRLDTSPK